MKKPGVAGAGEKVRQMLRSWKGVSLSDHPAGGTVFEVKGQEIGQILGNASVGITFTAGLVDELMVSGEVDAADVSDDNHGRLVVHLRQPTDISHATSLLERSYWDILMIDEIKKQLT